MTSQKLGSKQHAALKVKEHEPYPQSQAWEEGTSAQQTQKEGQGVETDHRYMEQIAVAFQ